MMNRERAMMQALAVLAGILILGLSGTAGAFHDGGVAHCDGCHSMHNSPENPVSGSPNNTLLKGSDPSSTCLNCHQGPVGSLVGEGSYHIKSDNASSWTPGGDFFWLSAVFTTPGGWPGAPPSTSDPDNFGHNVVAGDFSMAADATNTQAPGGTFPSSSLGCNSCHNPHGQVNGGTANGQPPVSVSGSYGAVPVSGTIAGNYRLLRDSYDAGFSADAPIAVTAGWDATDASHPAYGQGMAEWCGNCHGDYANAITPGKHKSGNGAVLNGEATNYNAYVATGDFTGLPATSFTELVQFERQETDKTILLAATTSTAGPDGTDNVMCLTCHRAHASAFNNITRWDMDHELLADGFPTAQNLIDIGALPNSDYYGRSIATDFGDYQRSLCNKCHVKD
jgi:hypothetical protein